MRKAELRKEFLEKRAALDEVEFERLTGVVAERLFLEADFSKVGTLHVFLPIERLGEVDTWPIIYRLWVQFPNVRTVAPRTVKGSNEFESIRFTKETPISEGAWGVPEPCRGNRVPPSEIDVVLVPLLCFDERGHRIGYGKGFYDRFLARCRPDCLKIGLSYFPPVDDIDDVTESDVRLDRVVHPLKQ